MGRLLESNRVLDALVFVFTLILAATLGVMCQAADLTWDYPGDNEWDNNLVGYTIHYSDPADQVFTKTIYKADTTANATTVRYSDIENKLNLQYNTEYTLYLTAFDETQESIASNTCTHTREGHVPPEDTLPPIIVEISGPVTIIINQ